ncbi:hypothetical protein [Chondrinema litorale]|uniref:hypothetical protein n=1 Tax=Chondrinema litorale TaxID=2994555 RepID=UPI002542BC49|nr:hypothetical protein [Chondrinema litorale]UZR97216.1 hypothetical protein OQ292_25285 [Chondrinema litorale]
MDRFLIIFCFAAIFNACGKKNVIEGNWQIDYNNEIENQFFPDELIFRNNSLQVLDRFNFSQTSIFKIANDSIYLTCEKGIKVQYPFIIESDSIILFAGNKFIKSPSENALLIQPYQLIGWKSTKKLSTINNSNIIHLIKDGGKTKVILNDLTTELDDLHEYLIDNHSSNQITYIYIGKGVNFNDLIETYCWLKYSGFKKVELITDNHSFDEFYSIIDNVNIDETIFMRFLHENKLSNLPPKQLGVIEYKRTKDVYIIGSIDFHKIDLLIDSTQYFIHISEQLTITNYFELIDKLNSKAKNNLKRTIYYNIQPNTVNVSN